MSIFRERNMPVAEERSIAALLGIHGRHPVFRRWRNMAFIVGLPVPSTKAPYSFCIGEQPDEEDNTIHRGQDRML